MKDLVNDDQIDEMLKDKGFLRLAAVRNAAMTLKTSTKRS